MERTYPAGEVAHVLILKNLMRNELGFEELVRRLEGQISRGTVSKYLNDLYGEDSEEGFRNFVKRKGRRGAYYVPEEKRREVELFLKREEVKRDAAHIIDNAPLEEIEEFRELKRLAFPLYTKLEAELFRAQYESGYWRNFLAGLEKHKKWKLFFSVFEKSEIQKLSHEVNESAQKVSQFEAQVAQLRRFFDSEEEQQERVHAINQALLEIIEQRVSETKGSLRGGFYADWLADARKFLSTDRTPRGK